MRHARPGLRAARWLGHDPVDERHVWSPGAGLKKHRLGTMQQDIARLDALLVGSSPCDFFSTTCVCIMIVMEHVCTGFCSCCWLADFHLPRSLVFSPTSAPRGGRAVFARHV